MKKALVAVLMLVCATGCKKQSNHVNNAKPVPIGIHEVVDCNAVQSVPVIDPRTGAKLCVDRNAIVTEKNIRQAVAGRNSATNEPEVQLYLDNAGADRMYEATQRISARYGQMAIVVDGNLISAPAVRDTIKDAMTINGNFTDASAQDLADILTAGK